MHIQRVQVEAEGFLSGLDVEFSPGLNVIIGARGTGKTSLIELIRYCLGAGAFTDDAAKRGEQQAIAILDGGAVTVTIRDGSDSFTVTRSASGHRSSTGTKTATCTVLAQNEIEAVGAQAAGRLHLIDRFRSNRDQSARTLSVLQARVRSLTSEVVSIVREMDELVEQIGAMSVVSEQLLAAREQQKVLLESARATEDQRQELLALQRSGQSLALRESVVNRSEAGLEELSSSLQRVLMDAPSVLQPWPEEAGPDPLTDARVVLAESQRLVSEAVDRLAELKLSLSAARQMTVAEQARVDESSRELRQKLDSLQSGIGATTRRVSELEEHQGQLQAIENLLTERSEQLQLVVGKRDEAYNELEDLRESLFADRATIVSELNALLAPNIRIRLAKSENKDDYRSAIVSALRGSGLHYNTLAPLLAELVSPHEIVQWVEDKNAVELGSVLGITPDRASSIISALRERGTPEIIASTVDDGAVLELLDGPDFKPTDRLSIGQRCTVVLPVLLGHHGDPLIVDQPEDHLDNAFIASTLVSALTGRRSDDQFIFSSHNANIPVLGNANRVLVMNSDGDRGYLQHSGGLEDLDIIGAVTDIMEGGADAFRTRASFYKNNFDEQQ